MLEYEEVMIRPEQREATGLDVSDVHMILDQLADELVLEAAINGRADVLVTFHVHDYSPAAQYFRLEVLRPAELLRRL
jgi:hypothetical protein